MSNPVDVQVPASGGDHPPEATEPASQVDIVTEEKSKSRQKKGGQRVEGGRKKEVGEGAGQGSPKLRGQARDSEEMRMSKTLTWVLRHGAQSEKLFMRPDGYVRVQDILARPRFKDFSLPLIEKLVANDSKTRFGLISEPDPDSNVPVWWIRANQGHSMQSVVDLETTPILSLADIPSRIAVHGTTLKAWESIQQEGLSKMKRNHVHLAQGIPGTGVISGMRNASQVHIYVDVDKAIDAGLIFSLSANGVILSAGDERGFIPPSFFTKVVTSKGKVLLESSNAS